MKYANELRVIYVFTGISERTQFIHIFFRSMHTGFLQLIGCLGALRLSEKLLNAYWLLLLVLLIGDAVLGIFWMFKFERIMQELQPMLR